METALLQYASNSTNKLDAQDFANFLKVRVKIAVFVEWELIVHGVEQVESTVQGMLGMLAKLLHDTDTVAE